MHLGRFHRAIELMNLDFKSINHVQLIQELVGSLNNLAANPGNQDIANAYKASLENCRMKLSSSALNNPRPILKDMLKSIEAEKNIGDKLFERIRIAISANPAAPTLAAQAIQEILEEVKEFYHHIENIDIGFSKLHVEYDELENGEAEIGLLVPKNKNTSTLKDLSKEFNQWHNALAPIVELFDQSAPPLQIKVCATTDWMFYLATTPIVLFGVSKCIRGVNSILKDLIETKSLIDKLVEKKVSSGPVEQLLSEYSERANNALRGLAEGMVDEHYKGEDNGRKNELKTALRQSLSVIAEKITSGAQVEVRMLPPVDNEDADAAGGENSNNDIAGLQALAQALDNEVQTLNFDGEPINIKALLQASEDIDTGK